MAVPKIIVEEKLGGQIAFGGKEIRVLKATYEAISEEKRSEFDSLLIQAQDVYQNKVAEVKKAGERPQASKLKAEAIAEVITPFLEANAVSKGSVSRGEPRVVRPTVTRETKKTKEAVSATDEATLKEEFDDFPTDMLNDSSDAFNEAPKDDFSDLEDELGLDDVLGEDDEEGTNDIFNGPDAFGSSDDNDSFDIDLDI